MISIRARSHQIIRRRLARRSTRAPAGRAISAKARVAAELSRPTWNVLACSTTTAVSGSASTVTAEPISLTVWPLHSNRKSRCRQSVRARTGLGFVLGASSVSGSSRCTGSTLPGPVGVVQRESVLPVDARCGVGTTLGGKEDDPVPTMKVTPSAAMRARDVSRPHAEHLARAEAAEAEAGPAGPVEAGPVEAGPVEAGTAVPGASGTGPGDSAGRDPGRAGTGQVDGEREGVRAAGRPHQRNRMRRRGRPRGSGR